MISTRLTPDPAAGEGALPEHDAVQPFSLESSGIRGSLVRLGGAVDEIVSRHDYPEALAALLSEMLALTALQSSLMKYDGVFTLQTKGDGPVGMMVVDVTSDGTLRGYAAHDAERLAPGALGLVVLGGLGELKLGETIRDDWDAHLSFARASRSTSEAERPPISTLTTSAT